MQELLRYDYPGNVRELKNILERFIVLSDNHVIQGSFHKKINHHKDIYETTALGLREARAHFECDYITRALESHGWNVTRTAQDLGITDRQLWNKIHEYEIKIER